MLRLSESSRYQISSKDGCNRGSRLTIYRFSIRWIDMLKGVTGWLLRSFSGHLCSKHSPSEFTIDIGCFDITLPSLTGIVVRHVTSRHLSRLSSSLGSCSSVFSFATSVLFNWLCFGSRLLRTRSIPICPEPPLHSLLSPWINILIRLS